MLNETIKHYDMEVNFFSNFLDSYMKYTSGLFETRTESLETATRRMLDKIIDMGNVQEGANVLEIGPGWGSLLKRIQEREIKCVYTGVSPSKVQNKFIQSFARKESLLHTSIFEDFENKGVLYDSIILIGSFCHLHNKFEQLKKMNRMLKPEGTIVIEDTFFKTRETYNRHAQAEETKFVQKEIFGFAEILSLSEQMDQIGHANLKVTYMLEHSDSYKLTIDHWIKRLQTIEGQPLASNFIKYLGIAQRGWNYTTQNQLLVLRKTN